MPFPDDFNSAAYNAAYGPPPDYPSLSDLDAAVSAMTQRWAKELDTFLRDNCADPWCSTLGKPMPYSKYPTAVALCAASLAEAAKEQIDSDYYAAVMRGQ